MRAHAIVAALAILAAPLAAQDSVGTARPAVAPIGEGVLLQVRPRKGDTLRVTLDHSFTLTGGPKNSPDSTTTATTSYHVVTRNIVESTDGKGSVIRALIDSVRMKTTGSIGASPFPGVDRGMEGLKVRLRIMPDGSSQLVDGQKQIDPELVAMLGAMPAVMPLTPVKVGDSWVRDLPLPEDGAAANDTPGSLRATFKFDSLTDNGDMAWISIQGRVVQAAKDAKSPGVAGTITQMTGTLTGSLRLDRKLGWLAESRATVSIESILTMPGGGSPLMVKLRLNQVMHTARPRR